MTVALLKAWILSVMLVLEPSAPWKETFEQSSQVMAESAIKDPLFCTRDKDGNCHYKNDDIKKTAALYLSIGWFESHFQQDAEGDCDKKKENGTCVKGSTPHSFCMFQINDSNLKGFGTTKEEIKKDFSVCMRAANKMMRESFRICGHKPLEDRLRWYAAGQNGCPDDKKEDAIRKSHHRMNKAIWIFNHYPLVLEPAPTEE